MKKYLLIGTNSDIAQAVIPMLIEEGHEIYSTSRNEMNLSNPQIKHTQLDLLNDPYPEDFLPEQISGLVYFPGTINLKPFRGLKPEQFAEEMNINFFGAVKIIQWALKKMDENSSIVLFSTVAVQKGMRFHASIASAKGAVEGLTRSLAAELAPKIRVNAIAPSLTNTKLSKKLTISENKIQSSNERHPLKRIGEPKDIAEMTTFLLSERSKWITGQILGVDGGLSAV